MYIDWDDVLAVIFFIILVLIGIGAPIFLTVNENSPKQEFIATITNTQIDDGNTYYVLTKEDGVSGVYENKDNMWYRKFNSSDFMMNLEIGKTYRFVTVGTRKPFWSFFPNIISYSIIPE